ncbi:MAG: hypothetical protein ACK41U_10400 [Paracoccus sp. (in: a-proteobacteria)]|uniref:hypothetical protein n=1 Tax=Paracoccus sp. TaxID=267 RepID=UPI00391AB56C
MNTFATIDPAAAAFALHATEAEAAAAADAHDHLLVLIEADLSDLTMKEGAALFAATAAPLGIAPVKRFPDRTTAARRIWQNLVALSAGPAVPAAAPEVAPQPEAQPEAEAQKTQPRAKAKAPRRSRGIALAPKAEAVASRAGTKQALLVDLLWRTGGASMSELREALGNWSDATIKSGLSWDMNSVKGYGIRTTFENGYQRWLATDYAGQGTFHADSHPDDVSEAGKAALLAENLANEYDPDELFPVYHLVLPEGMGTPVPHTPARAAAMAEAAE